MSKTIALVTPVLDDWVSLTAMLIDICQRLRGQGVTFKVYAVDDGSTLPFDPASLTLPPDSCVASIEVIRLAANFGHQRAIAVGLCAVAEDDAAESSPSDG